MRSALYLHGLASSPGSKKAAWLASRLAEEGWHLHVPDLNVPTFEGMNVTAQVAQVEAAVDGVAAPGERVLLIGSSLGALSTLVYACRHPERVEKVLLVAPALGFLPQKLAELAGSTYALWDARGYLEVEHYDGVVRRLGFQLARDSEQYDFAALVPDCPTLIVHGTADEVVPYRNSVRWVELHPSVTLVPLAGGDHSLLDSMEVMWGHVRSWLAGG